MDRDLESLIVQALQELDGQADTPIPQDISCETSLFGRDGMLDSVGLVTLVVAVEQAIEDTFSVSVSLADEKAMSQKHSPYRTVGALAEYASHLIETES